MHRGRWQAQGGGIEESNAWAQDVPLVFPDGRKRLEDLRLTLEQRERQLREECFEKARVLCDRLKKVGGTQAPYSKSFPVRGDREGRRVDLEINAGKAFVP